VQTFLHEHQVSSSLKNAKKSGHRSFLKKDKLIVNGRAYDLEHLLGNIQLETVSGGLVTPANNRLEGLEEISQQNKGDAITWDTTLNTRQRDEAIWRRGSLEVAEGEREKNTSHSTPRNTPDNKSQPTVSREATRVLTQAERAEKRIVSSPAGSLVEVHCRQYNLRSWLTKTGESADRRRRGSGESNGSS
jgi:hypothetical protein